MAHPHPALGGKGLPPQPHPHALGPPPDLTERYRIKAKYLAYQRRWTRGIDIRTDLEAELAEKVAKVQALQDEVDLLLDQIHDSDYAHLVPARNDLFSDDDGDGHDDEDDNNDGEGTPHVKNEDRDNDDYEKPRPSGSKRKSATRPSLEEEEAERRLQLEHRYNVDGARRNVTRKEAASPPDPVPAPVPAPIPSAPVPTAMPQTAAPASSAVAAEGPPPKRLRLTFGNGAAGTSASLA